MKLFVLLILAVFASEKEENAENTPENGERHTVRTGYEKIVVKIEEGEYDKKKSKYIGMTYRENRSKWYVQRKSKIGNKLVTNGSYDDEETAAHASDTLARKLMENGEQGHKLNFPDDHIEVCPEDREISSKFIGVSYDKKKVKSKWRALRWSKNESKKFYNGYYDDEETAAHASDTLARKLMQNGEQGHKLNFPDDQTQVYPEKKQFTSKFIGVNYRENISKWYVQRWSKIGNTMVSYGYYNNEETAAHASDTLARKLIENGDHRLKLNFPEKNFEANPDKKRKRPKNLNSKHPQNN